MPFPIWKSVMYGLFIGTTVSSVVLFIFRIIPISTIGMIVILYLYAIVGGVTAYIVHKRLEIYSPKTESVITQKVDNPRPKEELVNAIEYKQTLDKIRNLKTTSLMLKSLIETRKKIEELKKESNSILEDTVEKLNNKNTSLIKNYLEPS